MTHDTLASFLRPEGFERPRAHAVLREASVVTEAGRYLLTRLERRPHRVDGRVRHDEPVVLVPGFLAGDGTLAMMARELRHQGFRTYRSHIHANVGCTRDASYQLEARLESIAQRRGSRVQLVGHSLGGLLARGIAVRRPDLVAGVVAMGSPLLAPGAHHASLTRSVDLLVRLSRAGVPGLMSEDCVAGSCARTSFDESRQALDPSVGFTTIFSRRDGIVDWRACIDPVATAVEVACSHVGMAIDPAVIGHVIASLRQPGVSLPLAAGA